MQKIIRKQWMWGVLTAFLLVMSPSIEAFAELQDVVDSAEQTNIYIYKGDLVSVKVYSLTRIAISSPGIVDIVNADVDELVLIGQRVGETQIFIWDEKGKRQLIARVVDQDLDAVKERIQGLLDTADISEVKLTINEKEGKIVATGRAVKDKLATFEKVLEGFTPYVINLVNEEGDLVQIDVQVSDLNTTLAKALGFDWYIQGGSPDDGITLDYEETLPVMNGSPKDFFKIGDFRRTSALISTINALIREGKGRVLSKPSIMVANGSDATLLIGGEIPVESTVQSQQTGTATTSVSYKEYGIDLTISPMIINDKIDLTLSIAIRDIDRANAVGNNVAFQTSSAETRVVLNDGQTMVIAGLIKQDESTEVRRVPFVSRVPIVGMFFRSTSTPTPNTEKEVVISLTPRIYRQKDLEKEYGKRKDREKELTEEIDEKNQTAENEEAVMAATDEKGAEGAVSEAAATGDEEELVFDDEGEEKAASSENMTEEPAQAKEEMPAEGTAPSANKEGDVVFSNEGWDGSTPEAAKPEEASSEKATAGEGAAGTEEKTNIENTEAKGAEETETSYEDEVVSKAIADYVQSVQKKISDAISFPEEAKKQGWEGTVPLSLTILSDGTLSDVSVKTSSGHEALDKDAMATAKVVAPFKPFPAEMDLEELKVTIPIVYSQGPAPTATSEPGDDVSLKDLVDEAMVANEIPAQVSGISNILAGYIKKVRDEFEGNISYPAEAKGTGQEGTVILTLIVLRNGNLNEVSIKQSSGYQVFDKDAISTAHILAPFEPFPDELKLEALVLSLPIIYKETP